ncbi:MAG: peptidoglycan DD-metalloendopeptidase family protein [Patescibacteria group bacterium]
MSVFFTLFETSFSVQAVNYNQQRRQVEQQQQKINENLDNVNTDLENAQTLGNSLKEEIATKDSDIQQTQTAIVSTNELLTILESQIAQTEAQRDEIIENIRSLFIDLQKQKSPFQTLLASENLADALSKFYSKSVLQSKADEYRLELEESAKRLEEAKVEQDETKQKLEQTQSLLASQQSYLIGLREQTQNDEAKYQELKNSLLEQNRELETKLAQIEAERKKALEEEERKKAAQEANRRSPTRSPARRPSSGGSGSGGTCWFEEKRPLNIPNGYFISPAKGFVTRGFANCTHDAVDIANGTGTPMVAIAPGEVVRKGSFDVVGYGIYIVLKHNLPSSQVVYTLYAHMNSASQLRVGETVTRGQLVGYMGCTGRCFGTHVHFMIYSDTYANTGPGCRLGASLCYDPTKYIAF